MNKAKTSWMGKYMMSMATQTPVTVPRGHTINNYLHEPGGSDMDTSGHTPDFIVIGNNVVNGVAIDGFVSPPRNSKLGILYGHLPFIIVDIDDDSVDETLYGCKIRMTLTDGRNVFAYFSKRVSVGDAVTSNTGLDGYNTTPNDTPMMHPSYPNTDNDPVLVTTHNPVEVDITQETLDACTLYAESRLGNADIGRIKEIGLCAGNNHKSLILLTSTNVGGITGIESPKKIKMSIGISSAVRSTGGWGI